MRDREEYVCGSSGISSFINCRYKWTGIFRILRNQDELARIAQERDESKRLKQAEAAAQAEKERVRKLDDLVCQ